jgi:hypothetical protein
MDAANINAASKYILHINWKILLSVSIVAKLFENIILLLPMSTFLIHNIGKVGGVIPKFFIIICCCSCFEVAQTKRSIV